MSTRVVGRDRGELQVLTNDQGVIRLLRSFAPLSGLNSEDQPRAKLDAESGTGFESWMCNRTAAAEVRRS